jgi:hypothetical protein
MPFPLPLSPTVPEVKDLVYRWMDLLAAERYTEALELMAHDPALGWTPELLKDVINGYGLPWSSVGGAVHVVSDRSVTEATETRLYEHVELYTEPLPVHHRVRGWSFIGTAWFDLPLDGQWSDLTAAFDIVRAGDHAFLELDEVHVF